MPVLHIPPFCQFHVVVLPVRGASLHSRLLVEHDNDDNDVKEGFKVMLWKMNTVGRVNVKHKLDSRK
jgi:hypothetical protein